MSTTRKISPIEHAETAPERRGGWVAIPASSDTEVRVGFDSLEERNRVLKWLDAGLRDARPGRLADRHRLITRARVDDNELIIEPVYMRQEVRQHQSFIPDDHTNREAHPTHLRLSPGAIIAHHPLANARE